MYVRAIPSIFGRQNKEPDASRSGSFYQEVWTLYTENTHYGASLAWCFLVSRRSTRLMLIHS
ncbi:hypothetical protein P167DRAFT_102070 [Morchella conica CCBAS932]|uniref:Uncharacterized protein n=1 Tax=Morchella conica CCBAS932 TaxID=1392247 RepID=A0A3N4KSK4_9PEZI|nr:hypothetical protein P167DRAFT_102070 [Morchella conica CCBAS932]